LIEAVKRYVFLRRQIPRTPVERSLAHLDITLQEMRIAGLLMREIGITQKDLAEKLSVRDAELSVAITKFEKQGLITRKVNSADKRVQFLSLKPSSKFDQVDNLRRR
jgi:DNA-binding MarR family transcriptional regulator